MILVTGGAGYIGSHTTLCLLEAGYDVVVADNFSNSKPEAVKRLRELAVKPFEFEQCELRHVAAVEDLFNSYNIDAVVHFAGLKAVGESVEKPLEYFDNNLSSTLNILKVMGTKGIKKFVFSSSSTVYGTPKSVPIFEDFPLSVTNPYGRTKLMIEDMLRDLSLADDKLRIVLLRYFNPIGAHPSGQLGEDPQGIPNNLLPYISQVAVGKLAKLSVYGDDYPTHDGTGVRDYIHVVDVALGHVAALKKIESDTGVFTYNLGTGKGSSVLDIVRAFEAASEKSIPYLIAPRRAGDIAECYANSEKAFNELGWKAKYTLAQMCEDSWRWQKNNPNGYEVEKS